MTKVELTIEFLGYDSPKIDPAILLYYSKLTVEET